jgi:hypothetical protein
MFLSILSFKTINKLKLFFESSIPMPQDAGTPLLSLLQIVNLYIISMGLRHWLCRDSGDSGDSDILRSKRQQSGKDSVIEGQPLLMFM